MDQDLKDSLKKKLEEILKTEKENIDTYKASQKEDGITFENGSYHDGAIMGLATGAHSTAVTLYNLFFPDEK